MTARVFLRGVAFGTALSLSGSAAMAEVTYGPLRCASKDARPDLLVMVVYRLDAATVPTWAVQAKADGADQPVLPFLAITPEALDGCRPDTFPAFVDGETFLASELEFNRLVGEGPIAGLPGPIAETYWTLVD